MIIFLIGMMGAGKTSVGIQLSKLLGFDFHDVDHEIEKHCQSKINHIFQKDGEHAFRSIENYILKILQNKTNSVIATGGGLILSAQNRKILKKSGTVVYLKATLSNLHQRLTAMECMTRPLIANDQAHDKQQQLYHLLQQREKFYKETADITIETSGKSIYGVAEEINKIWSIKVKQ